jgi:hypothetical protein
MYDHLYQHQHQQQLTGARRRGGRSSCRSKLTGNCAEELGMAKVIVSLAAFLGGFIAGLNDD